MQNFKQEHIQKALISVNNAFETLFFYFFQMRIFDSMLNFYVTYKNRVIFYHSSFI